MLKLMNRLHWKSALSPSLKWYSSGNFTPKNCYKKLGIVGVPFGKGQKKTGNSETGLQIAPDTIRKTGVFSDLQNLGLDICDYGNVSYTPICGLQHPNMINLDHFAAAAQEVSSVVERILKSSRSCLVLGGDHSIATGSMYGHMQVAGPDNVAVIYVDAHADINTDSTSPSGNLHGMTVAMLAKELRDFWPKSKVPGLDWLAPCLHLKNLAFIGLRSVDSGEIKFITDLGVTAFSMEDIDKYGIREILTRAMAAVDPYNSKSIHLSFDIDSLDSMEAPCTTAPVRGGLTLREGIQIGETICKTGRLSVVDLVEVNPSIGTELQQETTIEAAKNILLSIYGHNRRGNLKEK